MDTESEEKPKDVQRTNPGLPNSLDLFAQFQAGDSGAASELFDRYVYRLIALARSRLRRGMRRRVDPEDIVHSAYRSFFIRAAEGDFELQQSGDLWRLLAQITLNKVRKQTERQAAACRDYRRDGVLETTPNHATPEPTPEEAATLVEQVRLVAERLTGDERLALTAFLKGGAVDEIANQLSKSPRTVRRALARVRSLVEREILGLNQPPGHSLQEIPPLTNPLLYSDFRLERLIGAGGIGKVYRATQLSTGETVAVKALRKDKQTDSRAVRQFLHEAEVVSGLKHPGIICVKGLGRFPSGGYFIVMEWVDGDDLQALIDNHRLTHVEALRILEAVGEAVAHAHEAGVVHCDLKPGNILVGDRNKVVVTDFGFAHMIAGETEPLGIGGTLGYLAPELTRGDCCPTPAADVYGLGRILERLTEGCDPRIGGLINRCLSLSPTDRPRSAQRFLEELIHAISD